MNNLLENYYSEYPIYQKISFSRNKMLQGEKLHPIFVLTQNIIDNFIKTGSKRIAIVLPDEDCNIVPMVIAKYFSNIQNEIGYAGSILDEIKPGQHLMLGKAVVEFLNIDKTKNSIKFKVGRSNPMEVTCPINGVHYMFEKTERSLSGYKQWLVARKEAEAQLNQANQLLNTLKNKRTVLKKTMTVVTSKGNFFDYVENLYINGSEFSNLIAYGEIDSDENNGFKLHNKGKLDCIPGISVTSEIAELKSLIKKGNFEDKISAVYIDNGKFDELTENPDSLKYILKKNVPVITFVPESKFELYPTLSGMGFDFWHWKPSTLKLIPKRESFTNAPMFGQIGFKINRAISAEFKILSIRQILLRKSLYTINRLSQITANFDYTDKKFLRRLWAFQNKLSVMACNINDTVAEKLNSELYNLLNEWQSRVQRYKGQEIESLFDCVFEEFDAFIKAESNLKSNTLKDLLSQPENAACSVTLLVPNDYEFLEETRAYINGFCKDVRTIKLKNFYNESETDNSTTDILIVLRFDKDEYIRIKQTYCYKKLIYILYDFESKWRNRFIARFDQCLPHEYVKLTAAKLNIPIGIIDEQPFDKVAESEDDNGYEEIADYNISHKIIRSTFGDKESRTFDTSDTVECIPIVFEENKVGYFYPNHDVIDVTALIRGDFISAVKKSASYLKKGDNILIRQSGKDIIRERADLLMDKAGESGLRDVSELWLNLFALYAAGKSVKSIHEELTSQNIDCTLQQVNYWLSGETIMPRDKNVLKALAACASEEALIAEKAKSFAQQIDRVFDAGRKVQAYHQKAGRSLTSELKSKAAEIKALYNTETAKGIIDGIGEVCIYTVEAVLDKETIGRGKLNRIEDI